MKDREGKFIVIEGVGGSGKTEQMKFIGSWLEEGGLKYVLTREPGGVEASEKIRSLIFDLRGRKLIGPEGQMVLFFAARKLWVDELVTPSLEKGINIITDRCHTTTAVYQGIAEGGNLQQILEISDIVLGKNKPDAVIFLDVSAETAQKRKVDDGGDPYDKEGIEYQRKLVNGYRKLAGENWGGIEWFTVNGEGTIEEVSTEILKILEKIFSKNKND